MRIVVYDLECKVKPETKADWTDWAKLGISVGCAYDFKTGEYTVYMDDNLQALVDLLNQADMIAAFNHIHFDNNLLRGVTATMNLARPLAPPDELFCYDMLVESRAGAKVDMYAKGFKLDAHLKATLGIQKTGDGGDAPALWQAGKLGELTSYCLADVHRERLLFEHIWALGNVSCEHGTHVVKWPQEVLGYGAGEGIVLNDPGLRPRRGNQEGMVIGVDLAKPGEDRSVKVTLCLQCGYLHLPTEPHIYEPCSYCGKVHRHGTPHLGPEVPHDGYADLHRKVGIEVKGGPEHGRSPFRACEPLVDHTNPEDL